MDKTLLVQSRIVRCTTWGITRTLGRFTKIRAANCHNNHISMSLFGLGVHNSGWICQDGLIQGIAAVAEVPTTYIPVGAI
jgi:hypothetical protein